MNCGAVDVVLNALQCFPTHVTIQRNTIGTLFLLSSYCRRRGGMGTRQRDRNDFAVAIRGFAAG